jgi:hypothetical protein
MNLSYFYSTQEPLKSNGNNCRDSKLGISYLYGIKIKDNY